MHDNDNNTRRQKPRCRTCPFRPAAAPSQSAPDACPSAAVAREAHGRPARARVRPEPRPARRTPPPPVPAGAAPLTSPFAAAVLPLHHRLHRTPPRLAKSSVSPSAVVPAHRRPDPVRSGLGRPPRAASTASLARSGPASGRVPPNPRSGGGFFSSKSSDLRSICSYSSCYNSSPVT